MQHPFLDINEISKLSLEEIQQKVSDLSGKLQFASRTRNAALMAQLQMVLETYRTAAAQKLDEVFQKQKQDIQNRINIKEGS